MDPGARAAPAPLPSDPQQTLVLGELPALRTPVRFAGVTVDTSRDIDFADIDGDADLDVYVANRGTTANGGEVARSYRNQGGANSWLGEDRSLDQR